MTRGNGRVPDFPVYLFDIDGTLLDSAPDICASVQTVLVNNGRSDLSDLYLRGFIGRHLTDLFAVTLPGRTGDQYNQLILDYRAIYSGRGHASTRAFPGTREALAALGGRKATATTKGTPTTRLILEMFGMLPYFDHVQGTDGFPAKPAPDVIQRAIEGLGAHRRDCLLVGDSGPDMEAGRRAGVRTCAVRWGYGNHEEMARWEPDFWIDDPAQLLP